MKRLIEKYNVPGPRYTSYPTVPQWKSDELNENEWVQTIAQNIAHFNTQKVSVYIHLPFCESLCTFCGCHKRITKNHQVEVPYINAVLKEWEMYRSYLPENVAVDELHLGGGTPTFFEPLHLRKLLEPILGNMECYPANEGLSFEAHPNNTSKEHLEVLFQLGFRRLSLGVQDYSPIVQKAIHRIQPFQMVKKVHEEARSMGYTSISHDLVFGLPKQKPVDILNTVEKTLTLRPERIALYSYAHVPWIKGNGQRGFDENDLPKGEEKRHLYEIAKLKLISAGYIEIGMDHFALPEDQIAKAFLNKNMHRNFMGYTTQDTPLLIGLGASAISDSWFGFAQNEKKVEAYQAKIESGHFAITKGHILSPLDLEIRQYILDLMCHFETTFNPHSKYKHLHIEIMRGLQGMIDDGLIELEGRKVIVTSKGIPFVRNCCMVFDQYLNMRKIPGQMYSQTI